MHRSTKQAYLLNKQTGFISTIILIILGLVGIKYFFNFDIVKYLMSDNVKEIFEYIKRFFEIVWSKYIAGTFLYLWNNIVIGVFWKGIVFIYTLLTGWVDKN